MCVSIGDSALVLIHQSLRGSSTKYDHRVAEVLWGGFFALISASFLYHYFLPFFNLLI